MLLLKQKWVTLGMIMSTLLLKMQPLRKGWHKLLSRKKISNKWAAKIINMCKPYLCRPVNRKQIPPMVI
ncbi:hypothetical protein HanRHA438_Chr07g0313141 [Helianthus annuus]|uniref:Uncharacterized protein n=1 Tax=Helianthus annuus TaxID=4232 RepID=A0A9K3NH55_HELAN|nr:hypothetical protein HanXRQr2_Chr07g0303301 [Helianthus annuus]KAJ0441430.1 hypothetical protein HanIR_Chr16g0797641 [Helianthus annuus]KAJ0550779.1 hypothetical protein HanHA300_Chr07g0249761 [Helianthus annuus]KAJ0563747.1 hypothetical protein HanHA89_Chr07g0266591 [Helianthus annuus]KAJ0729078.1 hypothetical protein HanLR1_Chr07g0248881 [Helianthus annuus]